MTRIKDGVKDTALHQEYVYNFASSPPISTNNLLKSKRQLFVTTSHELPIYWVDGDGWVGSTEHSHHQL